MNTKKRLLILLAFTVCLSAVCIGFMRFAPVSWDAGACGGGYGGFILEKYESELTEKLMASKGGDVTYVKAVPGTQEAEWDRNTIRLDFDIVYKTGGEEMTERVSVCGHRVWTDTFEWDAPEKVI